VSLRDTVNFLSVPQRYVFAFYSACAALGLLAEQAASPPVAVKAEPARPADPPPLRSLFKRLLGKLLGARLGEDIGAHA
jgi:hypothetical protein